MITVVGTIQIGLWRYPFFVHSLKSIAPIAHLLSWRLNIAGEKRKIARDLILKQWANALITTDDNSTCTYDLISAQLASLPGDALVYPWIEDVWFVCPHVNLFLYILDEFVRSQAKVMPVSHLVTLWEEQHLRTPIVSNRFYSEYLIDLPSQERIRRDYPDSYWVISIPSIFKACLLREVVEYKKEHLSQSHSPHDLELQPGDAGGFLADRSFIRLVPHFHIFREVVGSKKRPRRCVGWHEARGIIHLRDAGDMFGGFPGEHG